MNSDHIKTKNLKASDSGFALISVLILVAFLILVLVIFSSIVQVETRSTGNATNLQLAQNNALAGLRTALGELQVSMGPDQRISAPASIFDADPETEEIEGVANPFWIAAFPSVEPGNSSSLAQFTEDNRNYALGYTTGSALSGGRTPTSKKLKWLVSMPGEALDSSDPDYDPGAALNQDADQLSGGESITLKTYRKHDGTRGEIHAGKIPIKNASDEELGSYAWWIGDEGVKARFNVLDPDDESLTRTASEAPIDPALFALQQARGSNFNHAQGITEPRFQDIMEDGRLEKLVSGESMSLLDGSWADWYDAHSTDITFTSRGIPTDVVQGRLKQDLSVYLETGKGLDDSDDILRGGSGDSGYGGPAYPVNFGTNDNLPKFGVLRSWNELGKEITGGAVESRPQTLEKNGLHPHVKRYGVMTSLVMTGSPKKNADGSFEGEFVLVLFPFIELWNPYNFPLPAEKYLAEVTAPDRVILNWNFGGDAQHIATPHPDSPPNAVVDFDLLGEGLIDKVDASDYDFGENRAWLRMVVDTGNLGSGPAGLMPGESVLMSPELGAVSHLRYNQTLKYRDYTSGANVNLAEHKAIDISAFRAPDGCYIFLDHPRKGILPMPDPANPRYYRARYKNPSLTDGTADSKWNGTDAAPLFRLSLLKSSGPTLLTSIDPVRSNFDSINNNLSGWDWHGHTNSRAHDGNTDPANPFVSIPRINGATFAGDNGLRNADTVFSSTASLGPGWVQGGFRILGNENPRGGMLRTASQFPDTWVAVHGEGGNRRIGRRPIHRIEPYEMERFAGHWRLPFRTGPWGRTGAYEGWFSAANNHISGNTSGFAGTTTAHFDFPRRFGPIHSLGQLMHANLNPLPWGASWQVGYSRLPAFIQDRNILTNGDESNWKLENEFIDLPYLINSSLIDRFFLSTIPQTGNFEPEDFTKLLPNNRQRLYETSTLPFAGANLRNSRAAFEESAAHVMIEGSFNINSTSVTAWEAFLLSKAGISMTVEDLDRSDNEWTGDYNSGGQDDFVAFPRFPDPVFGVDENAEFDTVHPRRSYFPRGGNHVTNRDEIRRLAGAIVEEVKRRGPFLSMADFVNRRLIEDSSDQESDYLGLMGTLDAAILKTSQDPGMLNHQLIFGDDPTNIYGITLNPDEQKGPNHNPQDADERERLYSVPRGQVDSALEGYSSYLIQGDILAHLGAFMTPRSDTFTIRAYGDTKDKFGNIIATARCEALVQRISEPVKATDNLIAPTGPMGRKLKIVGFRWLQEDI